MVKSHSSISEPGILLVGDILTLALVTVLGFARHEELNTAGVRLLSTFVPLLVAWILVSPHLLVFDAGRAGNARQLWRPFWAMVLAAPLAAFLRGIWLNAPILPVFVIVIGGVSSVALLAWRGLYYLVFARKTLSHG